MRKILLLFCILFSFTINYSYAQQWANQELIIINNTACTVSYEVEAIVITTPGDCNNVTTFTGSMGYNLPPSTTHYYDSPNTTSYGPNYYPWAGWSPSGTNFTWSKIRLMLDGCDYPEDLIIAQCCASCPPSFISGGFGFTLSCTCNGAQVQVSYTIVNGKCTVTIN